MKNKDLLLLMGILCLFMAFLLMVGCSPVKKVLKDPAKVERVVAEWRVKHPLDTSKVIIKGKDTTIIRETVKVDSIKLPYPVNHKYTEIRIKDRLVTDTVYIRDTAMIGVLIRKIEQLEITISDIKAENKSLRGFKAGVIFLGILAVVIAGVALIKKFKIL